MYEISGRVGGEVFRQSLPLNPGVFNPTMQCWAAYYSSTGTDNYFASNFFVLIFLLPLWYCWYHSYYWFYSLMQGLLQMFRCFVYHYQLRLKWKTKLQVQVPRVLLPSKRVGIRTQSEYEAHCESGLSGPSRCLTIATLLATADYNDGDDDDDEDSHCFRVCFD